MNLTLQRTTLDGLVGAVAAMTVDYLYITLAIVGIGKLLENKKVKKAFGITSSIVLALFGIIIIQSVTGEEISSSTITHSSNLLSSFASVFFLTLSSPLTIVLFTSVFAAKAVECNYTKKELAVFGLGTAFATFIFMSASVVLFSLIKESVPVSLIQIMNVIIGCLLLGYGGMRLVKVLRAP